MEHLSGDKPEPMSPAEPAPTIDRLTDRDLSPGQRVIGNMWQEYYRVAHRELVVANRAVQRLSQRCKNLRFTLHNLTITLGRNERERFEHWAEYGGLDLERDEKFQYCLSATNLAWECWQARARLDGTQNAAAPLSPPSEKIK